MKTPFANQRCATFLAPVLLAALSLAAPAPMAWAQSPHPAMPAAADKGVCPVQHDGMTLPAASGSVAGALPPATQPGPKVRLQISVKQGTAGAPVAAGDTAVIEVYRMGQTAGVFKAKIDDHGQGIVSGVPSGSDVQALITVTHAGVPYEGVVEALDGKADPQPAEVTVYEASNEEPAWQVKMRHVMVHRMGEALQVMEMIDLVNPSDRTWLGRRDEKNKLHTLDLSLSPEITDVQLLAGFRDGFTTLEHGQFTSSMPLLPGESQLQIGYAIPIKAGSAFLGVTAPAKVGQMMVFIPAQGVQAKVEGLTDLGVMNMNKMSVHVYQGRELAAAAHAGLMLSGMAPMAAGDGASPHAMAGMPTDATGAASPAGNMPESASQGIPTAHNSDVPKLIAGVGGAVILALGLLILLAKPRKATA